MSEQKPKTPGKRLGELSPAKEWVWLGEGGAGMGWQRADTPADLAVRKLDE